MIGERFGRLTVLSEAETRCRKKRFNVVCDCGNRKVVQECNLKTGHTKSCGCLNKEVAAERAKKHGKHGSPEYYVWNSMRSRCNNPTNKSYKDYGERGITVCERWNRFENFIADMGERPTSKHEIDRINNDGNYEPSNCRWVDRSINAKNKRNSVRIPFHGKAFDLREASNISGIKFGTLKSRLARGIYPFKGADVFRMQNEIDRLEKELKEVKCS